VALVKTTATAAAADFLNQRKALPNVISTCTQSGNTGSTARRNYHLSSWILWVSIGSPFQSVLLDHLGHIGSCSHRWYHLVLRLVSP
jgi:hypothetical protein